MPDSFLALSGVSLLLKVAEKTVYTEAQCGQLPAVKVRGEWRFQRSDLERWIEDQKAAVKGATSKGSSHD
jgi:excisionase family DNA binding protein